MNVAEKVRSLLEQKAEKEVESDKPVGPVGHEQRRRQRRAVERYTRRTEPVRHRGGVVKPSARELFEALRKRRLASRPVLQAARRVTFTDQYGRKVTHTLPPVYGEPTFRNVIDENGRHV